jgi:transcriptional regulator with XRE-family HTH domain
MTTYEIIIDLCKKNNLAVTALEKELGFGRGSIGKLKSGKTSADRLQKIANYFNVSVNYLLTGENDKPFMPQTQNQEIIDFANRIMSDKNETFRKRFISALAKAKPEFWDGLEQIVDETLNKD